MVAENSLLAYWSERQMLDDRKRRILEVMLEYNKPMTDRDVKLVCGFDEMNSVRPRITEMLDKDMLDWVDNVIDPYTKKRVRRTQPRKVIPDGPEKTV